MMYPIVKKLTLLIFVISMASQSYALASVCERTSHVQQQIVLQSEKLCADITALDLLNITNLDLSGKFIEQLQFSDFNGLHNLQTIDLSDNSLLELPSQLFNGLVNLQTVNLADNDATIFLLENLSVVRTDSNNLTDPGPATFQLQSPYSFAFNISVSAQAINGNLDTQILTIPAFATTSNTVTLTQTNTSIQAEVVFSNPIIPTWFGYFQAATTQFFSGELLPDGTNICDRTTQIVTLIIALVPDKTACSEITALDLQTITYLSVNNKDIQSLQSIDLLGLTSLQTLDLSNNNITELPIGLFQDLQELTWLGIHQNSITTLTDNDFTNLVNLVNLYVSKNQINSISDDAFTGLNSLRLLDLSHNQISSISNIQWPRFLYPGDFSNSDIRVLNLMNNQLTTLDVNTFDALTFLITIHLSDNLFTNIPNGWFSSKLYLQFLDLSNNQISTIHTDSFSSTSDLKDLDLSHNQLTTLPDTLFQATVNINDMFLNDNLLTALPTSLSDSKSMVYLHAHNNQINDIPLGFFAGMETLSSVKLANNSKVFDIPMSLNLADNFIGNQTNLTIAIDFDYALPFDTTFSISSEAVDISLNGQNIQSFNSNSGDLVSDNLTIAIPQTTVSANLTFSPTIPSGTCRGEVCYDGMQVSDITLELYKQPVFSQSTPLHIFQLTNQAVNKILPAVLADEGSITYSIQGNLPTGISFSPSSRKLIGSATEPSNSTLIYQATDAYGNNASINVTLYLTNEIAPYFSPATIAPVTSIVGEYLSIQLPTALSGQGSLNYLLSAANGLPSGMVFNNANLTLYGTPTEAYLANLTFQVTDEASKQANLTLSLTINNNELPVFTDTVNSTIEILTNRTASSIVLPSSLTGNQPLTHKLIGTLPGGMAFDTQTLTINGMPTEIGTFNLMYIITDANNDTIQTTFDIEVSANQVPSYNSSFVLINGSENAVLNPYIFAPSLTGEQPLSYTFNELRPGLVFNASNLQLAGTPSTFGNSSHIMSITDGNGDSINLTVNISIDKDIELTWMALADNVSFAVNTTFNITLPAASGNDPVVYSIDENLLPNGISFDAPNRTLSGISQVVDSHNVNYSASDIDQDQVNQVFLLNFFNDSTPLLPFVAPINIYQNFALEPIILPQAIGGNGNITYSMSDLPDGLLFDQQLRRLSGITQNNGTVTVHYFAEDEDGSTNSLAIQIVIETDIAPSIDTVINNQTYSQNQVFSIALPDGIAGNGKLSYALVENSNTYLGQDFFYNNDTKILSGSSNIVGDGTFTYSVTDIQNDTYSVPFTVSVVTDLLPTFNNQTVANQTWLIDSNSNIVLPAATNGNPPLSYTLLAANNDDLPAGFSFDPQTRQLDATPISDGNYTLIYQVIDQDGDIDTLNVSIITELDTVPTFTQPQVASTFIVNTNIIWKLTVAVGGNGQLSYSLNEPLPQGLSFDPVKRSITGVITAVGSINLTYTVEDSNGDVSSMPIIMHIETDAKPQFVNNSLTVSGYMDNANAVNIPLVENGNGDYNFEVSHSYASLVDQIYFDDAAGVLIADNLPAGNYSITLTVTDSDNIDHPTDTDTLIIILEIFANLSFTDTTNNIYHFLQNQAITELQLPTATGGQQPITYALIDSNGTAIANGLSFSNTTRIISGIPLQKIDNTYSYIATDANNQSLIITFTIAIGAAIPQFSGDITNLTYQYSDYVNISLPASSTANIDSVTYALQSKVGVLPLGLGFNATSRTISGIVLEIGTWELEYRAINSDADYISAAFNLTISEPLLNVEAELFSEQALLIANQISGSAKKRIALLNSHQQQVRAEYIAKNNMQSMIFNLGSQNSKTSSKWLISIWSDQINSSSSKVHNQVNEQMKAWHGNTTTTNFGLDFSTRHLVIGTMESQTDSVTHLTNHSGDSLINLTMKSRTPYIGVNFSYLDLWLSQSTGNGYIDVLDDAGNNTHNSTIGFEMNNIGGKLNIIDTKSTLDLGFEQTQANIIIDGSSSINASAHNATQIKAYIELGAALHFGRNSYIKPNIIASSRTDSLVTKIATQINDEETLVKSGIEISAELQMQVGLFHLEVGLSTFGVENENATFVENSSWVRLHWNQQNNAGLSFTLTGNHGNQDRYYEDILQGENLFDLASQTPAQERSYSSQVAYVLPGKTGRHMLSGKLNFNAENNPFGCQKACQLTDIQFSSMAYSFQTSNRFKLRSQYDIAARKISFSSTFSW